MPQNRPDIIKRFIGVASNTITHRILVKSELEEDTRKHYTKEIERDIDMSEIANAISEHAQKHAPHFSEGCF